MVIYICSQWIKTNDLTRHLTIMRSGDVIWLVALVECFHSSVNYNPHFCIVRVKYLLVSLSKVCSLISEGGLSIRDLMVFNRSLRQMVVALSA
jgi:hypothetical protein